MTFTGVYLPALLASYSSSHDGILRELATTSYAQHVLNIALGFALGAWAPADVVLMQDETWERCQARFARDIPTLSDATCGRVDLICAALPRVYGRLLRLLTLAPASRDAVEDALHFAVGHPESDYEGLREKWTKSHHAFITFALGLEGAPPACMPPDETAEAPVALNNAEAPLELASHPTGGPSPLPIKRGRSATDATAETGKRARTDDGASAPLAILPDTAQVLSERDAPLKETFVLWADGVDGLLTGDDQHFDLRQKRDVLAAYALYSHLPEDSDDLEKAMEEGSSIIGYGQYQGRGISLASDAQTVALAARFAPAKARGVWWFELAAQEEAPAPDAPGVRIEMYHRGPKFWWIVDVWPADQKVVDTMVDLMDYLQ
jgi:hypothetical protein